MVIDTVLLDAGGVLTFPNWHRISDILERHGIRVPPEALSAADPHARFAIDDAQHVGATTDADRGSRYFRLMFERAGVPTDAPLDAVYAELWDYHSRHNLWEHVPADVPAALARLRGLGVRLSLASNANGLVAHLFERVGLASYFDAICDSCIEGVEKPDPRFYHIALARVDGSPESAIHVGDLYHVDIVGARRAGIRPVLLDPDGLYRDFDVERVASLGDVVELVAGSR